MLLRAVAQWTSILLNKRKPKKLNTYTTFDDEHLRITNIHPSNGACAAICAIGGQTERERKLIMSIEELQNEYTDWLVENLPREYVENQDCRAEAILFESLEGGQLTLNDEQKIWLHDFCKRWNERRN